MRKLGGFLLIGALVLTACSAPAEQLTAQPLVGNVPSTTATITAAPIAAKAPAAEETTAPESDHGDYTQDEFYIAGISSAWIGEKPTDDEFLAGAKYVCEQIGTGVDRAEVRAVAGEGEDAEMNNKRVIQYSLQVYCPELGY